MSNEKPFRQDDTIETPKQPREHQQKEELDDLPAKRVDKDEQVKGGRYETEFEA